MTKSPFPLDELHELAASMIDETISGDRFDRLCELLHQHDEAQQFFVRYVDLHATLRRGIVRTPLVEQASVTSSPSLRSLIAPAAKSSLFRILQVASNSPLAATLIVAAVLYGLFGYLAWDLRSAKRPSVAGGDSASVATVRNMVDVQWSKSAESSIRTGEPLAIRSGTIDLELQAGVRLVVEGPAEWSVDGRNRVLLRSGKLQARVPKQAIGFIVETPTAKIVDLGTEFAVEVADGETSVHVLKGVVELSQNVSQKGTHDKSPPPTLRLSSGKAVRTTAQGIVATEFVPEKFVRSAAKEPLLRAGPTWMIDLKTAAATQSSSHNSVIHPAQCAIDGDRQTASHTAAKDSAAWLQIDLKAARSITAIVLFSRPDSAGWLRDITVKLLAEDGKTVVATSPKLNPKNTWGGGEENFIEGPSHVAFDLVRTGGGPSMGRYVRIEREPSTLDSTRIKTQGADSGDYWPLACKNALSVAEAQVFGSAPSVPATITRGAETDVNTSASIGAAITWGAATDVNTSTLTDFSTAGTLFDAGTIYPTADLVIGTTRAISFHRREISSNNPLGFVGSRIATVVTSGAIGIGSQVFDSVPTNDYQRMLSHGTFGHGARDLVISGLTPGHQYQVQVWTPYWDQPAAKTTFTAGNSVTLKVGCVEGPSGPVSLQPQFAIGTFTANATRQVISYERIGGGDSLFGAMQVRDLTPLSPSATDDKSATKP